MDAGVQFVVRLPRRRHNGVLVEHEGGRLWWETVWTRRGARRAYGKVLEGLLLEPARSAATPGDVVRVCLIERRRIVQRQDLRIPGDPPPDAGVREPRRDPPSAGGTAAVANE
jgi:hypothetical protein